MYVRASILVRAHMHACVHHVRACALLQQALAKIADKDNVEMFLETSGDESIRSDYRPTPPGSPLLWPTLLGRRQVGEPSLSECWIDCDADRLTTGCNAY